MTSPTPSPYHVAMTPTDPPPSRWSGPPANQAERELYDLGLLITARESELDELRAKRWKLIYQLSKHGLVNRRLAYLGGVAHSFVGRVRNGHGRPASGRDR